MHHDHGVGHAMSKDLKPSGDVVTIGRLIEWLVCGLPWEPWGDPNLKNMVPIFLVIFGL